MIDILMMTVLCAAMFGIGVLFGSETSADKPKKNELPKFDKMSNTELLVLFMAAGDEMERRGMVERVNVTPFDELKK